MTDMTLLLAFLALLADRLFGYPDRLLAAIGHPVMWIGRLIDFLDERWNRRVRSAAERRRAGIAALVVIVAVSWITASMVQGLLGHSVVGIVILAFVAGSLIAQKSLQAHVEAVADALERDGLEAGRSAVSMIVGRDPDTLGEAGVSRAAIESLAENFSDGVVAPAFWLAALGLPGAAAYKAVNTADSMIGHMSERHHDFGWASARFDDLVNWPAARLTALLVVAAAWFAPGASPEEAWNAVRRDAANHRSPNAGWPEAAFAGALGLSLAGPRSYGGEMVDDHFMGHGRREANAADIRRALALYRAADTLLIAAAGALAVIIWRW
jgi:adenosylcobinamide-phosphate synthase